MFIASTKRSSHVDFSLKFFLSKLTRACIRVGVFIPLISDI